MKLGKSTLVFRHPVYISSGAAVVGLKESEGPLYKYFDNIIDAALTKNNTWENMEARMQMEAFTLALGKIGLNKEHIDFLLGGDLINQLTITNATAVKTGIPYLGLYNACATMAEALILSAVLLSEGFGEQAVSIASSHNATSERQYRYPTELGVQRPQTAQWTVTGAGAMVLSTKFFGPKIDAATVGKVVDLGIKDPNEMGAAMAPAVFDSLKEHFKNTNTLPQDYDLILSGDLGYHGHKILQALFQGEGFEVGKVLQDTGIWIYNTGQDSHSGGSGAGCSASVWSSYLLEKIKEKKFSNILLAGSGALLSPLSVQQGDAIPGICHVVSIKGGE